MLKEKHEYFPQITGIRGIACLMAYFYHFNPFSKVFGDGLPYRFVNEFHFALTFFFVLSGFAISHIYYSDNFKPSKPWLNQYFLNRIGRIIPLYFFLSTLTFIIWQSKGTYEGGWGAYFANITFVKGFFDDLKFTGIGQGWTLTVEEFFYLLAPLIYYIYSRYRKLYVMPAVLFLFGLVLYYFCRKLNFYGFFGRLEFVLYFTFFGRCLEFFFGFQLALLVRKQKKENMPLFKFRGFTLLGFAGIIVSLTAFVIFKGVGLKPDGSGIPLGVLYNNFVVSFFIAAFYYGLIYEKTIFSKILSMRWVESIGHWSYAFYLIHVGVFHNLLNRVCSYFNLGSILSYLLTLLSLLFISRLLFGFIQEPARKYITGTKHKV